MCGPVTKNIIKLPCVSGFTLHKWKTREWGIRGISTCGKPTWVKQTSRLIPITLTFLRRGTLLSLQTHEHVWIILQPSAVHQFVLRLVGPGGVPARGCQLAGPKSRNLGQLLLWLRFQHSEVPFIAISARFQHQKSNSGDRFPDLLPLLHGDSLRSIHSHLHQPREGLGARIHRSKQLRDQFVHSVVNQL